MICSCLWTLLLLGLHVAPSLSFQQSLSLRVSPVGPQPRIVEWAPSKAEALSYGRLDPRQRAAVVESYNNQGSNKRQPARQIVPISTALVIGAFSVLEILESCRELAQRRLGHAHGVMLLAFIRLCRSVAVLQTQGEEFREGLEHMGWEERLGGNRLLARLGRFLVSPLVTLTACFLAGFACVVEVFDDMRPGAHHGAALLALSELGYQIRRLRRLKKMPKRTFLRSIPFGMLICVAAAGYAAVEFFEDMMPGAHHGVAVLALAEMLENINRSKILKR